MNIFDSVFGSQFAHGGDAQAAISPEQWVQHQVFMAKMMQNAEPRSDMYQLVANYRQPVPVPQGFADWYAIGNELH